MHRISCHSSLTVRLLVPAQTFRHAAVTDCNHANRGSQYRDVDGNLLCENKDGNLTYYAHSVEPIYNKVTVDEGSKYKITLSDGTHITLDSDSEIEYPVGGDSRDVRLTGEALFEVTCDEQHPFTVKCHDGVKITVLGTKFNVASYNNSPTTVTLESGSIELSTSDGFFTLTPGQQAVVDTYGKCTISEVNAELYTSWANGIYDFDNTSLDDIIRELSLWYGVKFKFANTSLANRTFTGVLLRNKRLDYSLNLLKEVSNLKFEIDKDTDTIIIQ